MFMGKIDLYLFFLGHVSEFGHQANADFKKTVFLLVVICGRL